MLELIAQGNQADLRWQKSVPLHGGTFVVGRESGTWSVPWDQHISRQHVELRWEGGGLQVRRLPQAKNPVFFRGDRYDVFMLEPGEQFVIGATLFTLRTTTEAEAPPPPEQPFSEQTYSAAYLRDREYRDAARRVDVLGRLPEVIAGAGDDQQLLASIVRLLLLGISEATTVAILEVNDEELETSQRQAADDSQPIPTESTRTESTRTEPIRILHWGPTAPPDSPPFVPSRRLVQRAFNTHQSVLHVWDFDETQSPAAFTMVEDVLWSFATPVPDAGPRTQRWCLYVAGRRGPRGTVVEVDREALEDDLKFTELAAATISSLIRLRRLERQQTSLRQFFSPVVMDAIAGRDPEEVLAPQETEVSVLFCDLQGFSKTSEHYASNLLGLLQRVSQVLGLTTREILKQGGVVGDFHGDASMGFWGWPVRHHDFIVRACQTAIAIQLAVSRHSNQSFSDFRVGLGIATGRAVAGKIGTEDQVKVTVFGPVVNLAARLESMTRQFGVSLLIDPTTAAAIEPHLATLGASLRRVFPVLPHGLLTPLMLYQLLPRFADADDHTVALWPAYEGAVETFLSGDLPATLKQLEPLVLHDPCARFVAAHLAAHPQAVEAGHIGLDRK